MKETFKECLKEKERLFFTQLWQFLKVKLKKRRHMEMEPSKIKVKGMNSQENGDSQNLLKAP